jgi:hypothetical protein
MIDRTGISLDAKLFNFCLGDCHKGPCRSMKPFLPKRLPSLAARSGHHCPTLLDHRDRHHARGARDRPLTRRPCRRDAAPAPPAGRRPFRRPAAQDRWRRKFRSRQPVRRQGEPAMTAARIRACDLMTEQELVEVRTRSTLKSVALIAHAWTLILGSIAMVAVWPNPSCWRWRLSAHISSDLRS